MSTSNIVNIHEGQGGERLQPTHTRPPSPMPSRMDVSDASDEESEHPTSMTRNQAASNPKTEPGYDSAAEQAIDENQMINEEYKLWKVDFFERYARTQD